uniref:hypothetical protein n=1 Tax=Rhizobium pisi TaxID=574561 RepID=UPI003D062841
LHQNLLEHLAEKILLLKPLIRGEDYHGDKEIIDFLEKARAADGLRVQLGKDVFSVKISSETVSDKGREYLTKGGRVSE